MEVSTKQNVTNPFIKASVNTLKFYINNNVEACACRKHIKSFYNKATKNINYISKLICCSRMKGCMFIISKIVYSAEL